MCAGAAAVVHSARTGGVVDHAHANTAQMPGPQGTITTRKAHELRHDNFRELIGLLSMASRGDYSLTIIGRASGGGGRNRTGCPVIGKRGRNIGTAMPLPPRLPPRTVVRGASASENPHGG